MPQGSPLGRLPARGPERGAALDALELLIVEDVVGQVAVMMAGGWPPGLACQAYSNWLHELIAAAVDRGVSLVGELAA